MYFLWFMYQWNLLLCNKTHGFQCYIASNLLGFYVLYILYYVMESIKEVYHLYQLNKYLKSNMVKGF